MKVKDNRRITIAQLIISDFKEKKYLKGILTICSGIGIGIFFSLIVRGAIVIIIENNFSITSIVSEVFALIFCLLVFLWSIK